MEVTFGTTADVSMTTLASMMNAVYIGDPDSSPATAESYGDFCRAQNVDPARGVLARDASGIPIGVAVLARRGGRGWCGDFGIVPEWRRKGLGHRLMEEFVEEARRAGVRRLQLEVREENPAARRVYERAGYHYEREMVLLEGEQGTREMEQGVRRCAIDGVLRWPAPERPCWERELPSLLAAGEKTQALLLTRGGLEVALLVCEPTWRERELSVLHFGGRAGATADDLHELMVVAAGAAGGHSFRIGLEPVGSRLHAYAKAIGFREVRRYFEMAREL